MRQVILMMSIVFVCFTAHVKAQFVTIDPAHIATSIANTASEIVQTSSTVANVVKNFNEVKKVYEQGREYYDKLKAVNDLVKDARKVRDAILIVGEIGDIYVNSFQQMMNDPYFTFDELAAISNGYTMLLAESADMIKEMKEVVNISTLSMTDHERMAVVDRVYNRLREHRNLVSYYTRKNISVSYLRAKKANDSERITALYGNANDRYW